ncbi:MAG: efflux RND transporter periplasmic adaptor subunit [Wenzhouxiangella sp.]|nr:efflux RND transporter periplasmic adaptor subunit [Wenzhouxiangella sp.]
MKALIILLLGIVLVACEHNSHNGDDRHDHHGHAHHGHEHHDHDHHDHDHHDHTARPGEDDSLAERALGQPGQTHFVCPMHPQIVRESPGRCPICGMALVERERGGDGPASVRLHRAVQQPMNVRFATVERGRLFRRVNALGRFQVDESTLTHLHPRVQGWLDELSVRAAGDPVREGERLFTLYSPELVNIQEEFVQALRSGEPSRIEATRQRLAVLDVQPAVIARIERERRVYTYLPWYATRDGYVVELNVQRGMYVAPGTEMMIVADPTSLWLIAEIAGGQIDWLAEDQVVQIERPSRPGERLRGEVSFIYPELAEPTRTARARIVLDNPNGDLRPGDWARVAIFGDPKPDILYLPTEAIIRTGIEERVVVREDNETFSIRDIHAGLESGRYTEILHGLHEGEEVVISGHFLIDSEASIRAGHGRIGGQHDH